MLFFNGWEETKHAYFTVYCVSRSPRHAVRSAARKQLEDFTRFISLKQGTTAKSRRSVTLSQNRYLPVQCSVPVLPQNNSEKYF